MASKKHEHISSVYDGGVRKIYIAVVTIVGRIKSNNKLATAQFANVLNCKVVDASGGVGQREGAAGASRAAVERHDIARRASDCPCVDGALVGAKSDGVRDCFVRGKFTEGVCTANSERRSASGTPNGELVVGEAATSKRPSGSACIR